MYFKNSHIVAALAATFSLNAYSATAGTSTDTSTLTPTTTTTTVTSMNTAPAPASDSSQSTRIATQYATWAGSTANAQSLVNGLRTGAPITLQSTSLGTTPGTTGAVTFNAPTQNMGWGNVTKSLSLAQADLAAMGITNPTPQQMQTALMGGNITTTQGTATQTTHMDGILTMRSQGMGWGQIAHKLDLHPGTAFKSGRVENRTQGTSVSHDHDHHEIHHAETEMHEEHHALSASGNAVTGSGRVTTATGTLDHDSHAHGHETSHETSHASHAPVSRVVTAAGAPVSSGASFNDTEHGGSHVEVHQISHITTAAGGSMVASGDHGKSFGHGKD